MLCVYQHSLCRLWQSSSTHWPTLYIAMSQWPLLLNRSDFTRLCSLYALFRSTFIVPLGTELQYTLSNAVHSCVTVAFSYWTVLVSQDCHAYFWGWKDFGCPLWLNVVNETCTYSFTRNFSETLLHLTQCFKNMRRLRWLVSQGGKCSSMSFFSSYTVTNIRIYDYLFTCHSMSLYKTNTSPSPNICTTLSFSYAHLLRQAHIDR